MKKTAIIAMALLSGILSAETIQADLAAGGSFQWCGRKKAIEPISMVSVKGINHKVPQAVWDVKDSPYTLFYLKKGMTFKEFSSLTVKLKIQVEPGCPVKGISLRVKDKDGESFQLYQKADLKKGGIFELEYPVDLKHVQDSWGGNPANKTMDKPLRFDSFVFIYNTAGRQDAKVTILSVKAVMAELPLVAVARPRYEIGDCTRFFQMGEYASIKVSPRVLNISGIKNAYRFREKKDDLTPHTEPIDGLQIDARMLTGNGRLRAVFRDSAGKNRFTTAAPLSGRRTTVFLPYPNEKDVKYPVYLYFIEVSNTGKTPAAAEIYSVSTVVQQSRLDAVDLSVSTDTRIGVLRKGHEKALKFNFVNRCSHTGNYSIDVTMQHYSGKAFKEHYDLTIEPEKKITIEPKMSPNLWGHWDVTAEIREKSKPKESVKKTSSFAYLDPAGPTPGRSPGFLFSICTHTERWSAGEQAKEIEALALCGAKVARTGYVWIGMQPKQNEWRWDAMDRLVDDYGAVGVEIQCILGGIPQWSVPAEIQKKHWRIWSNSAPVDTHWRNYVSNMAKHYRGKIFYWENWNEPSLNQVITTAEYIRLQKSAFEEIRKASPEAVVMTGGFGTIGYNYANVKNPNFFDDFFREAKGYFDIHAQHEHGLFPAYATVIDGRFARIRKKYGITGPWYSNETAMHSMGGTVRVQAETLFKKLLYSWARGAMGYTWYDLRNDGFSESDPEHHFGMMTNDFVPKPVYSVFNMLAGTFRTAKFIKQWKLGENLWVFEFQDGAKRYLAAWDESQFAASHPIRIITDAKSAAKIDMMGNKTKLPIYNGYCIFEFGREPSVLELDDSRKISCAGELIEFKSKGVAVPGLPYPVKTVIYNPWKQKVTFTLSISGTTKKIQIAANGKAELAFEPIPSQAPLVLKWENSIGMKGSITIPVYVAKIIPAGSFDKRAPDFVLNLREHFMSLVEGRPETAHRVWKNSKDVSVKGWAGVFGNEVRFRFDVTDDVHKQPHSGTEVWMGDNIQLNFEIPGQTGYWEFGFSRLDSGKSESVLFNIPSGVKAAEVLKAVRLTTTRKGDLTQYQISIPFSALKTTAEKWKSGVLLNFIVNEDDGEGRDGWLQYAPGIGGAKDTSQFPLMIFR